MTTTTFIADLKEKFKQPLPGYTAQDKMSHATRKFYRKPPEDARIACVLALFYPKNKIAGGKEWTMVLIERESSNPNDRHGGQISFPGGKLEDYDESLEQGALREAEEEVGVKAKEIEILGALTELYIPVSNFLVYPFVGYLDYEPMFIPQVSEVRSIVEVPIADLRKAETRKNKDLKAGKNITIKGVPYFDVDGHVVWGATAMILSELLEVLK
jgi:8-oxo-dGTP pyrophosphatase MutT (NUDIX family)